MNPLSPWMMIGVAIGTVLLISASVTGGIMFGSARTENVYLKENLALVKAKEDAEKQLKQKGDDYEKTRNVLQGRLNRSQSELAGLRTSHPLNCAIGPERLRTLTENIGAANRAVVNDGSVQPVAAPGQ